MLKYYLQVFPILMFYGQYLNECNSLIATCDTKLSDLNHSISKVICPPNCWRQYSDLCGSDDYASGPLCLAAMHAGLMDNDGGYFEVYESDPIHEYKGVDRNGVRSKSCSLAKWSYTFKMKCSTTGNSEFSVTDVFCPPGCLSNYVCGTNSYNKNSSVCASAIHAGILSQSGGYVTFYSRNGRRSFFGSTKGGITSKSCGLSSQYLSFTHCLRTCSNNGECLSGVYDQHCSCNHGLIGSDCEIGPFPTCMEALQNGLNQSGVYNLTSPLPFQGYCDMYGGGWLVFQRRYDGSMSFNKNWVDYKNGFGNLSAEFWMGLEKLHEITSAATRCRLRVDVENFSGGHGFAEYSNFSIGDEGSSYRINVSGYSGNIGDSLERNNGMKFSTRGRDNDLSPSHCAACCGGAWWHRSCSHAQLNGRWSRTSTLYNAMSWWNWKRSWGGIMTSEMKVKCE